MKIKTFKYEKVEVADFEIPIPEETLYCFETGVRRAIRIIPNYTAWEVERGAEKESVFELIVTCVYLSFDCRIEQFKISIGRIEDFFNSKENGEEKSIITLLANNWHDLRTKENFEEDLQNAIDQINNPRHNLQTAKP